MCSELKNPRDHMKKEFEEKINSLLPLLKSHHLIMKLINHKKICPQNHCLLLLFLKLHMIVDKNIDVVNK